MKFNVFFKKDHGSHWVLSDGSPLFESPLFETRPKAIDDLENFVGLMESPIFIKAGDDINSGDTENCPSVVISLKQHESLWGWELFISKNGQLSKVTDSSGNGFDSLELAKQSAQFFINAIIDAPILDQADVAIPGMHFSKSFEETHHIGDIHPSSKWFK